MPKRPTGPAPRAVKKTNASGVADVMNAIRALVAALSQSARAVERDTGVTNAQLFVLRELARDEPLSVNDVAARAMTRQSTASLVISRLVSVGLVNRETDAEDARRVRLWLTRKGRRIVERAPEPPTAQVLRALRKLSPRSLDDLGTGLTTLLDTLGLSAAESPPLFERSRGRSGTASASASASASGRRGGRATAAAGARRDGAAGS